MKKNQIKISEYFETTGFGDGHSCLLNEAFEKMEVVVNLLNKEVKEGRKFYGGYVDCAHNPCRIDVTWEADGLRRNWGAWERHNGVKPPKWLRKVIEVAQGHLDNLD